MVIPNDANITRLPSQSSRAELKPKPLICLVVLSSNSDFYEDVLLPALRLLLEQHPYYWHVVHSHDKKHNDNPQHNITEWMEQAKVYIVDISEQHPDTFVELGRICQFQKQKNMNAPIIVLESKKDVEIKLSSREEVMRIAYKSYEGKHAISDLAAELKEAIENRDSVQKLNADRQAHYLSAKTLVECARVNDEDAPALTKMYETMENFLLASPGSIIRLLRRQGLNKTTVEGYKQEIKKLLDDMLNQ